MYLMISRSVVCPVLAAECEMKQAANIERNGGNEMLFVCYPKCSTCRKAQKWLDEHGLKYELRDIKEQNPTEDELQAWQKMSGLPLKKFFNTSGMLYRDLHLKDKLADMSDDEMVKLLSTDGMLVKRPILVSEGSVLVGFREEEWKKIL